MCMCICIYKYDGLNILHAIFYIAEIKCILYIISHILHIIHHTLYITHSKIYIIYWILIWYIMYVLCMTYINTLYHISYTQEISKWMTFPWDIVFVLFSFVPENPSVVRSVLGFLQSNLSNSSYLASYFESLK